MTAMQHRHVLPMRVWKCSTVISFHSWTIGRSSSRTSPMWDDWGKHVVSLTQACCKLHQLSLREVWVWRWCFHARWSAKLQRQHSWQHGVCLLLHDAGFQAFLNADPCWIQLAYAVFLDICDLLNSTNLLKRLPQLTINAQSQKIVLHVKHAYKCMWA